MKVVKFIECSVGIRFCNFSCDYCYIRQNNKNGKLIPSTIDVDLDVFREAFDPKRWGGFLFISICGFGETTLSPYLFKIVSILLELGHIVSVTTNGSIKKAIDEFCSLPKHLKKHLMFQMSFHYLELKRLNLLDTYISNFKKLRANNISAIVKFNLSDSYIPYIDEIIDLCKREFGGVPGVYPCRDDKHIEKKIKYLTKLSVKEYFKEGQKFESSSWPFMFKMLNKKQKKYCYAGSWSYLVNLDNGDLRQCYFSRGPIYNIYKNPSENIPSSAVGFGCEHPYCVNADFFMGMGVVPSIKCDSFLNFRNAIKNNWVEDEITNALEKLYLINKKNNVLQTTLLFIKFIYRRALHLTKRCFKKLSR